MMSRPNKSVFTTASAVLLATSALAAPAFAQSLSPIEQGVVAYANLNPVAAERTGTLVSVIDEDDLKGESLRVDEVLSRIPGFNLRPSGGMGGRTGFSLRGAPQGYVGVLIDGIDVTDPSEIQMAYDFGMLTAGTISRVEVTPGSQTAVFGGNAVAGAINMSTRTATEDGWKQYMDAEIGSYETLSLSYGLTYRDDRGDLALTLSHTESEGFSALKGPEFTEADGFEGNRISMNGGVNFDNGLRLGFAGFVDEARAEFDGYSNSVYAYVDDNSYTTSDSAGLRLYAEYAGDVIDHTLAVTGYRLERVNFDEGAAEYAGERLGLSYLGGMELAAGRLSFGLERVVESYDEAGFDWMGAPYAYDGSVTTDSVFSELTWAFGTDVDVAASLRYDDHSTFGGFATGRLAVAYRPSADWVLRAQAGTGYRAPSPYQLYNGQYGNTGLDPETSTSFDLSAERALGADGFIRATAFWFEVDQMIAWDGTYVQSEGTNTRQGVELAAEIPLSERLTLLADYTYTDSDVVGGVTWAAVPSRVYGLGLAADLTEALSAKLDIRHVADREGFDDYTLTNAALAYDFGNGTAATLRVENLTDEDYTLVDAFGASYGTAGQSLYLGLNAAF